MFVFLLLGKKPVVNQISWFEVVTIIVPVVAAFFKVVFDFYSSSQLWVAPDLIWCVVVSLAFFILEIEGAVHCVVVGINENVYCINPVSILILCIVIVYKRSDRFDCPVNSGECFVIVL